MNRLIIIEGPQGTGKTTLANYLRENIASANLYRLCGQKDKSINGKINSVKMYNVLLDYLEKMVDVPMDLIIDRTFFSEEVYSRLKYKEYSFHDEYLKLVDRLKRLEYEIYFINLYLENTKLFEERLKRDHHNYQAFSVESSISQQNIYQEIARELSSSDISIYNLPMDDFDKSYALVKKIFGING